ncbi:hypothetical protein A3A70_01900 [candidate division WWE3 bacterium RIFCSPLOWO2_01_FULL_42_11]|uniref:TraG P-loop domain-containing protein n=1 Tax=candidate division WWE3 bacterium RIFCSPLOWO2_01_FULL_42_11 TaxID=1802627 RepID=A0A1F4VN84_UNCKA|nr:MAG: hypothetical protein A3A70_01900 [candidate division WWE3 bacterium RIFCSPLOWO2_01_FULL_42_11]
MKFSLFKKKQNPTPTDDPLKTGIRELEKGMVGITDVIAPSALEVDFDHLQIANYFYRTIFASGYPRFVGANWLSPIINFDHTLDISFFYYPVRSKGVLDDLRRKIAEIEATMNLDMQHNKVVDPSLQANLEDAKELQELIVKGIERYFRFSFYITISAESLEELNQATKNLEGILGSLLVLTKHATLQMEEAFQSTIPVGIDKLKITRNMDTTSLASTFPFTSSELTQNKGILYGINEHNGSLIIFDRFSMENANSVVFAKSGAGKSYLVKLEALRSLMFGIEMIIVDPENEYQTLCASVGGEYLTFSQNSPIKINPFDLSNIQIEGENALGMKILSLHTMFDIMLGGLNANEQAILDRALIKTYSSRGITSDPLTQEKEPPLMEDLYKIFLGMEDTEAKGLASRMERYIKGSMMGIFDQPTNFDIQNTFTVFAIRDMEDALRPAAMFIILDFIWNRIRRDLKKRLLIVDEAWYLMKHPQSATFMYSLAKRARKYYLGLTTITQDVEDFMSSEYGRPIITNSSMQILLKQHPAAIDALAEVFYLSEGEKQLLLAAGIGEGLFFAGSNHVAMQVVASEEEHQIISSNPEDILKRKAAESQAAAVEALPVQTPSMVEATPAPPVSEVGQ